MIRIRLRRQFAIALGFASVALVVLLVALVVNEHREEWFGVNPRSASHNFSFNLGFFIPATLSSSLLSVVALIFYLLGLIRLRRAHERPSIGEWIAIVPALPVYALDLLLVGFVVSVLTRS